MNVSSFRRFLLGIAIPVFLVLISSLEVKAQTDKKLHLTKKNSYVKIGDLDISGNQVTVEARVKLKRINALDIVSKHLSPRDVNYLLRPGWGQVTTYDNGTSGPTTMYASNSPIPADTTPPINTSLVGINTCYHFAMVYNGQSLKAYINGCLVDSVGASGTLVQNDFETKIGSYAAYTETAAADSGTSEEFFGFIDEVRIWSVARTANDVLTYMDKPLPNPSTQTGLEAYYNFDNDYSNIQGNTAWDGKTTADSVDYGLNVDPPAGSGLERVVETCDLIPLESNPFVHSATEFCDGDSVKFSVNPSHSDAKIYWSTGETDVNDIIVTTTQAVSVTTISRYGCVIVDGPVDVIVNPLPVANAGADIDSCASAKVGLTGSVNGGTPGYTYDWSPSTGLSCATCKNPKVALNTNETYTFTVTDAKGCSNASVEKVNVTVNQTPTVVTNSDLEICSGDSITIDALASGGDGNYSYAWHSNPTGLSCVNCTPVSIPTTTTRYYVVEVTDGNGCVSEQDSMHVLVNDRPSVDALPDTAVCSGTDFLMDATARGGDGNYTYVWTTNPAGLTCTDCNPLTRPTGTERTYIVEVTDGNGCASALDSMHVTILTNPVATTLNDITICSADSVTINATATGGDGNYSYDWHTNPPAIACVDCTPITISTTTTRYYIVEVTDGNGCVSSQDSMHVQVNENPTGSTAGDAAICIGDNTTLSVTGSGGNGSFNYVWSPSTSLSDPNIANPVANPTTTTTYTVSITDGNNCNNKTAVQSTVTVNPLPNADAGPDGVMCINGSALLSASGGTSYSWSPITDLSNPNVVNPIATPTATTTYTVTVTDSNGCSATDDATVTVNNLPSPNANAGGTATICQQQSTQLSSSGGTSYLWAPPTSLDDATQANPLANPMQTTTYYVQVTDANGCSSVDSVTITVNDLPGASAGGDQDICNGTSINLQASGGDQYSWTPPAGLSDPSSATPTANPTTTTTYIVDVTNNNGCSLTDTITITVLDLPQPNPSVTQNGEICKNSTATLSAQGGGSYNWTPANGLNNDTLQNPSATPQATTTYTVTVTAPNGCTQTDNITVTVHDLPIASAGEDKAICAGETATLTATGGTNYEWLETGEQTQTIQINHGQHSTYTVVVSDQNGCKDTSEMNFSYHSKPRAGIASDTNAVFQGVEVSFMDSSSADVTDWNWSFGDGNTSNLQNPNHTYQGAADFIVELIVSNDDGCKDTATYLMDIVEGIKIPNVFTPNGDGINDEFVIDASGIEEYLLEIYDRWGLLMFTSTDPNENWNGKNLNGYDVPEGTYFYIVKAKFYSEETVTDISGPSTLIKGAVAVN